MRLPAVSLVFALLVAVGCTDADSSSGITPSPIVVPEDQRVTAGGPVLAMYERCFGECRWFQEIPVYALYDDGRLVQSSYEIDQSAQGGRSFTQSTSNLSDEQVEALLELAVEAGLRDGFVAAAGSDSTVADGGTNIFVSELGTATSFVNVPHLGVDLPPRELRHSLVKIADEFKRYEVASDQVPQDVSWAVVATSVTEAGDPIDWLGPSPSTADDQGCLLLGNIDDQPGLLATVSGSDATFGVGVVEGDGAWILQPRPLMPHESGCSEINEVSDWFSDLSRSTTQD